jgi:hypothetical protein
MAPQKETPAQDRQTRDRATRQRVALIISASNLEFRELQQQLFRTGIAEGHGGLRILTRSLNLHDSAYTKALVLYRATLMQIAGIGV